MHQHVATLFAQAEAEAGADLPQFVKDGFDAFLECGICPSCGARRMAQTAAHLVDYIIPQMPDCI